MKPLTALLSLAGVLAVVAVGYAGLFSDPKPATAWRVGPHDVRLEVVTSPLIDKPVLEVPRSLLVTAQKDDRRGSSAPVPTVVAGVALSAAFVLTGLWFSGRTRWSGTTALLALTLSVVGAGTLLADLPGAHTRRDPRYFLPAPPPAPAPASLPLPARLTLSRDVRLTVVESGETIRLVMPEEKAVPAVEPPAPRPIATSKGR